MIENIHINKINDYKNREFTIEFCNIVKTVTFKKGAFKNKYELDYYIKKQMNLYKYDNVCVLSNEVQNEC